MIRSIGSLRDEDEAASRVSTHKESGSTGYKGRVGLESLLSDGAKASIAIIVCSSALRSVIAKRKSLIGVLPRRQEQSSALPSNVSSNVGYVLMHGRGRCQKRGFLMDGSQNLLTRCNVFSRQDDVERLGCRRRQT